MSDLDKGGLADLRRFVDSYTIRAASPPEPPTLMEIARFPHRENVYSNILKFLLDTEQAHDFGPLFIRSIMAAYRCHYPDAPSPETVEATNSVEREVWTAANNRIDLLIDCADFLLCIENKIHSDLDNPLCDYRSYCEGRSNERPVFCIVLSPHGVASPELECYRFVSITYRELVEQVRKRMGSHIGPHNTRYQYLLFDFLDQASRFSRTATMNDDDRVFLDIWKQNDDKITNIQHRIEKMWKKLEKKVKGHLDQCRQQLSQAERDIFKYWPYDRTVAVFDLVEGGTIDGCGIFLHVEFHPLRITHVLGRRRGCEPTALASEINEQCDTHFKNFSDRSDRLKFVTEESPFDDDSVCENAVAISVGILRYIAARRLADTSDR